MKINGREIGPSQPPYIIAEISGNHCGSLAYAKALIEAAKNAGADAVKIQAYTPDTITIDCDKPDFIIKDGPWKGCKLYELYQKAHTPLEWIPDLFAHAREVGITLFASVFDETALEILERENCPAYKIASMEITDIPLIRAVAKTRKPVIISTGMAAEFEIDDAMRAAGGTNSVALACVSGYPTKIEDANLVKIGKSFFVQGISDHTLGSEIPIAATVKGAWIIEKHLMLDPTSYTGDMPEDMDFSMWPNDFYEMVQSVRKVWQACRNTSAPRSEESSRQLRRSLYVVTDMKAGDVFTRENVRSIRPAYGLPPKLLDKVLGRKAQRDIERGSPLTIDDLATHEPWDDMWKRPYYPRPQETNHERQPED